MVHSRLDYVVKNQPCIVRWAGFETNTYALQAHGWELAIEQQPWDQKLSLILNHKQGKMYGFCPHFYHNFSSADLPVFNIVSFSPYLEITRVTTSFNNFEQFDARPVYLDATRFGPGDFEKIFITKPPAVEEIIVEPQDVFALLEQIKKVQSPRQKEIRQNDARRDREAIPLAKQFHANIISLSDRLAA